MHLDELRGRPVCAKIVLPQSGAGRGYETGSPDPKPAENPATTLPSRKPQTARSQCPELLLVAGSTSGLERERNLLRFLGADRHCLVLNAVLLLPGFDRVRSGRKVLDFELAILACHSVVRVLENENIALHPRMDVALHRDGHFGARKAIVDRSGPRRLGLVPLAIVFWHWVDVVRSLIVVLHFERLPGHQGDNVRVIHTALLVERDRLARRGETVFAHVVLHIHHDVRERTAFPRHYLRWHNRLGVRLLTIRLGAHIDGSFGRWLAVELDRSRNGTGRRGVDCRPRGCWRRAGLLRRLAALVSAATCEASGNEDREGEITNRVLHCEMIPPFRNRKS